MTVRHSLVFLVVAVCGAGCREPALGGRLEAPPESGPDGGGAGGAGGAAGAAGGGGAAGAGGAAGSGGAADVVPVPGGQIPTAPGQRYTRCGTVGPEKGWRPLVSPDGRRLAARTPAGIVRLLDTATWRVVATIAAPLGRIDGVA